MFRNFSPSATSKNNKSENTIIILEDVHANLEAQTNLSKALHAFGQMKKDKPFLVGLEGASGGFIYEDYKAIPDPLIGTQVANLYLEEGKISGPAHAGYTLYNKEEEGWFGLLGGR